jgi:hypothetical protein
MYLLHFLTVRTFNISTFYDDNDDGDGDCGSGGCGNSSTSVDNDDNNNNSNTCLQIWQEFTHQILKLKNTVMNPHIRLDRPRGVHEAKSPGISRQSAHEGVKAVSPEHRLFIPQKTLGIQFC